MKGTEMFDAMAHIDEDLIDRCAAGTLVSSDAEKASARRRVLRSFAAIAAAVVIMIAIVSVLHIGGKSPNLPPVTGDPTAAPTAQPTETTAQPTEMPTVPTEEPSREPTELDFDSCAELAFTLPWGNGENEVFIQRPIEGIDDEDWVIPQHFNVIDGKVYVYDRFYPRGNGVLECDPATGAVTRLSPDIEEYDFFLGEFAVTDGKVIFGGYMFDIETGEHTKLDGIPNTDYSGAGILIMSVKDGKCFAYRAVDQIDAYGHGYFITRDTHAYDEYELDMENGKWMFTRRIEMPETVPHATPDLSDGSEFYTFDRYMGMDDAGNHYVDSEESVILTPDEGTVRVNTWHRIVKLAPDGQPTAFVDVEFPENYIHMWTDENYLVYKVDGDGTVWYMCETEEEVEFYRINLTPAEAPQPTVAPTLNVTFSEPEKMFSVPAKYSPVHEITEVDPNSLTYLPDPESETFPGDYNVGPQDFCFDADGNILILDSYGKKIMRYSPEGVHLGNITFDGIGEPKLIAYIDGNIWLFSEWYYGLLIDLSGAEPTVYELPTTVIGNSIDNIRCVDGSMLLEADGEKTLKLADGKFTWTDPQYSRNVEGDVLTIARGDLSWSIHALGTGVRVIGEDDRNVLYTHCSEAFINSEGAIVGNETIRAFAPGGEQLAVTDADYMTGCTLPFNPFEMDSDGNIWMLRLEDNEAEFFRITVGTAPAEAPQPTSDPAAFVPDGYDAHDYLALRELFCTVVDDGGRTFGESCFNDGDREFDPDDPTTWKGYEPKHDPEDPDAQSYIPMKVSWDDSGKVTSIRIYPSDERIPARLELTGFEKLEHVEIWDCVFDSITISDCPMLDGSDMVYASTAENEAVIEVGYIEKLYIASGKSVHCSLMGDRYPFVLDIKAEGNGTVGASSYFDGDYRITLFAEPDAYVDFLGWYDGSGKLVTSDMFCYISGGALGSIRGEYSYTAKFAPPAAPTSRPEGDFFCEIKPNVPASVDVDGDGLNDSVLVSVTPDDVYGERIKAEIALTSMPDRPFVYETTCENCGVVAAAVDFDPTDAHIETVICTDDDVTYVIRFRDDGSGFDVFRDRITLGSRDTESGYCRSWVDFGIPADHVFRADEGLFFSRYVTILGSLPTYSRFTAAADGIKVLDPEYRYYSNDEMKLKRELTVTLENGKTETLPVGAAVKAYSTDLETYVKVLLEDGSIGRVELTFENGEFGPKALLNGVYQEEYADLPYGE